MKGKRTYRTEQELREQLLGVQARGLTPTQAAKELGRSYITVYQQCRRTGIKLPRKASTLKAPAERTEAMVEMYRDGLTLGDIGKAYGISRERVRQILVKAGVTAAQGGLAVRTASRQKARAAAKRAMYLRRYGGTPEQINMLRKMGRDMRKNDGVCIERTPLGAFRIQRMNARRVGIPWEISAWRWWLFWEDSGQWKNRGVGRGKYALARIDKSKGFTEDNVVIAPFGREWGAYGYYESVSEAWDRAS